MQKDDLRVVQAKKAAQILMRAYRRQKKNKKSWAQVAKQYGLSNKGRAYMIAHGKLNPNPVRDRALMRAVLRECDAVRHPKMLLRFIRKVAVPFLERHQQSRTHLYERGGKPWKGWA